MKKELQSEGSRNAYQVSFMSARTDCGAGQGVPSAVTAAVKRATMSWLGVLLGMSRRISVFCSGLEAADRTVPTLPSRRLYNVHHIQELFRG